MAILQLALNSVMDSLENMQQQLQVQMMQLDRELEEIRVKLGSVWVELKTVMTELQSTREKIDPIIACKELKSALSSREGAARKFARKEDKEEVDDPKAKHHKESMFANGKANN